MKWDNLKSMKCPKCGGDLKECLDGYECQYYYGRDKDVSVVCDFSIRKERFDSVVSKLYNKKSAPALTGDERLSELNNYGRKINSEGFNDHEQA